MLSLSLILYVACCWGDSQYTYCETIHSWKWISPSIYWAYPWIISVTTSWSLLTIVKTSCYLNNFFLTFRIRRTYSTIIGLIFGIYWSVILFQVVALYALSLVLVERKKLELDEVIKWEKWLNKWFNNDYRFRVFAFASFFSQSARILTSL